MNCIFGVCKPSGCHFTNFSGRKPVANRLSLVKVLPGWAWGDCWNVNQAAFSKQSNSTNSPDVRYDTFIEMENSAVWEIEMPDGVYGVHVVAGDPDAGAGVFRIEAEGVPVVHGTPAASRPWIEGDAIVEVSDGRLTLGNGSGAMSKDRKSTRLNSSH